MKSELVVREARVVVMGTNRNFWTLQIFFADLVPSVSICSDHVIFNPPIRDFQKLERNGTEQK